LLSSGREVIVMRGLFIRLLPAILLLVAAPAGLHAQTPRPQLEEQDQLCLDTTFDQTAPFTPAVGQPVDAVRFETLLQQINAASGGAKIEAVAELLAALVEDRRSLSEELRIYTAMMLDVMQRLDECEAGHFCQPH
jgi:hypothetical protein